jgi:hypothetical protein
MIKKHAETWHPAYVSDYMPTLLDLIGVPHEHATWSADGISLLPLIKKLGATGAANDTSQRPAQHPLVFKLGKQVALIDNEWKILRSPSAGHCKSEPGGVYQGARMFNLNDDPTESVDLSGDPAHAALFKNMSAQMEAYQLSLLNSRANESGCGSRMSEDGDLAHTDGDLAWVYRRREGADLMGINKACKSDTKPMPTPPTPPTPAPPPPGVIFTLRTAAGLCLEANQSISRATVGVAACSQVNRTSMMQQQFQLDSSGKLFLAVQKAPVADENRVPQQPLCVKPETSSTCTEGELIWLGQKCDDPHGFELVGDAIRLIYGCGELDKGAMCLTDLGAVGPATLGACTEKSASGWVRHDLDSQ